MLAIADIRGKSEYNEGHLRNFRYWSWWLALYVAAWGMVYWTVTPEPAALFRRNAVFIVVGFFGAVLGNISAVGGGIVFIPVLIFLFQLDAVDALKIALCSQAFGMTSGAIGWMQKKVVPVNALKWTVPGLLLGSGVGSLVIHPSGAAREVPVRAGIDPAGRVDDRFIPGTNARDCIGNGSRAHGAAAVFCCGGGRSDHQLDRDWRRGTGCGAVDARLWGGRDGVHRAGGGAVVGELDFSGAAAPVFSRRDSMERGGIHQPGVRVCAHGWRHS